MNRVRLSLVAVVVLCASLALTNSAWARPTYGMTCTSCHSESTGHLRVTGTSTMNLGSSRLDKAKPGSLQTFTVKRGTKLTLPISVLNGSNFYAVTLSNFNGGGLSTSRKNKLSATVGGLIAMGSPAYYASTTSGTQWAGKAVTLKPTLTISSKCPADYYELYARVAGIGSNGWAQTQRIYIHVTP